MGYKLYFHVHFMWIITVWYYFILFQTKENSLVKEEPSSNEITSRSDRFKVKKRIVIGNVSKLVLETSVRSLL